MEEEEEEDEEGVNGRNEDAAVRNGCCADHGERMVGADEDGPSRLRANAEGPLGNGAGDMDKRVSTSDAEDGGSGDGDSGKESPDTGTVLCCRNWSVRDASGAD